MKTIVPIVLVISGCVISALFAGDDQSSSNNATAVTAGIEARMYLRHAKDWVETLFFRVEAELPTSPQEMGDLVSGIERDVKACDKALNGLKTQYAKKADAVQRIDRINQQNAKVQDLKVQLATECAKDPRDAVTITNVASEAWYELDAAEAETTGLLMSLKIFRRALPEPIPGSDFSNESSPSADAAATFGKGFRPHTAAVYQRSILDNARALDHYAGTKGPLPEATILEHVADIERQLDYLKKEYAKLDATFRKEKNLEDAIRIVEDHEAKLEDQVGRLKKSAATRKLNPTELKETSALISKSTVATLQQLYQVMSVLGTQPVRHEEPLYSP